MANFNKVYLIGNLTRDPEVRVTPKGTSICQFGLAVNRKWKDAAGEDTEEVTFVEVEAWSKQADTIAKYCTKGKPLFVEGRLKFEQWEDKASGQKRSKLKVVLEQFQFIGGREEAGGGGRESAAAEPRSAPPPSRAPSPPPRPAPSQMDMEEDVPF
jgi:single-strand DNA-binding protein